MFMHYQIALRSFGLITQVPDRVGRWFNYAGANDGQGEGDDTRAAVGIINNQFEHRAGQAAGALKQQASTEKASGGSSGIIGAASNRRNAPNTGASGAAKD